MKLDYSIFTSPGSRPVNEDYADCVFCGSRSCFILCDGLGGHGMGDKASRFTVDEIKSFFAACPDNGTFAASVIDHVQSSVCREQERLGVVNKMKTTAVILAIDGSSCICIHVGDSRLYHFRDGTVVFRTKDHSIPQMLVLMGDIKESEIRSHPDRNKLLRAIGDDRETVRYESARFEMMPGDAFLLCSDGFWEPVEDEQMCAFLTNTRNTSAWLDKMSRLANENSRGKSMDNCTAIAVRVR